MTGQTKTTIAHKSYRVFIGSTMTSFEFCMDAFRFARANAKCQRAQVMGPRSLKDRTVTLLLDVRA